MKSLLFIVLFFNVYLFSSNIYHIEKNLQINDFDFIGKDHLDRIWIRDSNTGKIKFLINENEFKEINSIIQKNLIYDVDLDFGEIFSEIGSSMISVFKYGNFRKNIETTNKLLGICWISEKEVAIAILDDSSIIKVLILDIESNKTQELFTLSDEKYENNYPFINLKYFLKNDSLYAFDFYKFRLKVFSFSKKRIIYQAGEERKDEVFDFCYVIKKEIKKTDLIIFSNFLIPNIRFGIDDSGHFFILKGCLNENTTYFTIFKLSEELKINKYFSLKNCYKNVFYHNGYLIFYTLKNSKIQYIELLKYD